MGQCLAPVLILREPKYSSFFSSQSPFIPNGQRSFFSIGLQETGFTLSTRITPIACWGLILSPTSSLQQGHPVWTCLQHVIPLCGPHKRETDRRREAQRCQRRERCFRIWHCHFSEREGEGKERPGREGKIKQWSHHTKGEREPMAI